MSNIKLPDLSNATPEQKMIITGLLELRREFDIIDIMKLKNNPDQMYETLKNIIEEKYQTLMANVKGNPHNHDDRE